MQINTDLIPSYDLVLSDLEANYKTYGSSQKQGVQWFRVGKITNFQHTQSMIFTVGSSYSNTQPSTMAFMVTVSNGSGAMMELQGCKGSAKIFDKARLTYGGNGNYYIDVHYNTTTKNYVFFRCQTMIRQEGFEYVNWTTVNDTIPSGETLYQELEFTYADIGKLHYDRYIPNTFSIGSNKYRDIDSNQNSIWYLVSFNGTNSGANALYAIRSYGLGTSSRTKIYKLCGDSSFETSYVTLTIIDTKVRLSNISNSTGVSCSIFMLYGGINNITIGSQTNNP